MAGLSNGRLSGDRVRLSALAFAISILSLSLSPGICRSDPASVIHSPQDDGKGSGIVFLPVGGQVMLHLYLRGGNAPSGAGTACESGSGDEHCGYQVELEALGSVRMLGFSAAGPAEFEVGATSMRIAAGDFVTGDLGSTKVGDLTIDATAAGSIVLRVGTRVTANLSEDIIVPATVVHVPEAPRGRSVAVGGMLLATIAARRSRVVLERVHE